MNLSIESLAIIQACQTLGIFVLGAAVIYVVARLDRAFDKGSKRLQTVLKSQQEFYRRIEMVETRHDSLMQRLDVIEARLMQRIEALDKKSSG